MAKKILAAVMAALLALSSAPALRKAAYAAEAVTAVETGGEVVFTASGYKMTVVKTGFRYGFYGLDGEEIVKEHAVSGLRYASKGQTPQDAADSVFKGVENGVASFDVVNTEGLEADVKVVFYEKQVNIQIYPEEKEVEAVNGYLKVVSSGSKSTTSLLAIDPDALGTKYSIEADVMHNDANGSAGIFVHFGSTDAYDDYLLYFINASGALQLKHVAPAIITGKERSYPLANDPGTLPKTNSSALSWRLTGVQ
jgi:hypothetical protein